MEGVEHVLVDRLTSLYDTLVVTSSQVKFSILESAEDDGGDYKCEASNAHGQCSLQASLVVIGQSV